MAGVYIQFTCSTVLTHGA